MALEVGTRLGPYEIRGRLGAGGMGDVYRARDTRLERSVAIKVLKDDVAPSPDQRARFEREARTVAALEHPHICSLYDVGREGDVDFLVMQYLEGDTLAERLSKGPLPLDTFYDYAIEIADAVGAAHKRGIVHRDLKPGNIVLTKSGAMVLDFGLAKLWDAPESGEDLETRSRSGLTSSGVILGTLPYMAPEQLQGKEPDPRTDIFAFGAVLYEMLTATKAFEGRYATELVTAVLASSPTPVPSLNPLVPEALERIVRRCLAKDPEERWQTMVDAREELRWVREQPWPSGSAASSRRRALHFWALLGAGAVVGAGLVASLLLRTDKPVDSVPAPTARFAIPLGDDESLYDFSSAAVAISPDGTRIAYAVNRGAGRSIHVRALDEMESRPIPGTERGSDPIFSPDGEWLAFESAGKLKKVPLSGGAPQFLANLAFSAGASWGPDDIIVHTPNFTGGLYALSARSGEGRRLTSPEKNQGHLWPAVLPDGKSVLFTLWAGQPSYDQASIALLSLETGQWSVVLEGASYARYAPPGHLLFLRGGTLFAAPFDPEAWKITGAPVAVVENVRSDPLDGGGLFDVSQTGALVYAPEIGASPARRLAWVDRSGDRSIITSGPTSFSSPRISPEGSRIAMFLTGQAALSVWIYGISQGTLARVTFGADEHNVAWSPDGRYVAFESGREGAHQLYIRSADGSGEDDPVTRGEHHHYLCDWSPDGRSLVYVEFHPESGADLWVVETEGNREARAFLATKFWEKQATFSPNGRWIAYVSDETGDFEVYVRPFPSGEPRVPISSGGGEEPAWSRSGEELFYRNGGRMMAVSVTEAPEFRAGRPEELFEGLYHYAPFPTRTYDVGEDGRFVMVTEPEPAESVRQLNVVLNWSARLTGADPK
ncbi:MAG TPA: protein kinase [Vicinamibacteria bacterium]|nr:protein kinase [Vicinamibacteria bacterium]